MSTLHCKHTMSLTCVSLRVTAGDVVVAYSPQNPRHVVCKRVLGLPGDEVTVSRTSRSAPRTAQVGT